MATSQDVGFMRLALREAQKGRGTVDPNPMVGAVIVENGAVMASGYHVRAGELHAERIALGNLGRPPRRGATMYVTLEPCSTAGRTGACTDYLIDSGISRVVIGTIDPNPSHRGRAVDLLRRAGITVDIGILDQECACLNQAFNERMRMTVSKHEADR